jgi:hypothetical protein
VHSDITEAPEICAHAESGWYIKCLRVVFGIDLPVHVPVPVGIDESMVDRNDLYHVPLGDVPEHKPNQLKLLTNIVQRLATQVETLCIAAAPTKHTVVANPTADFDRAAGGRHEQDAQLAHSNDNPLEYIDPRESIDYASRLFADCMPPTGTIAPCLENSRHKQADNSF